jgi:PAS domain S-box-containing protein
MPFIYSGRGALGALLLSLLLVAASLFWGVYDGYRAQERFQRDLGAHSVRDAALEIAEYIDHQRESVALLVDGRGEFLARLAANPSDPKLQVLLDRLLKDRFSEYHAFSMATSAGELLTDDMGENIGEVCREDVRRFAADNVPYRSYLHPMPGHYHYDVMVRWREGYEHGILFVSFAPKRLAGMLNSNQIPGHRLALVKASSPRLIEATAAGGRDALRGDFHLDDKDMARIADLGASHPVSATEWLVVDVPSGALMAAAHRHMAFQMSGIGVVFLALGSLAIWMARREARRQAADFLRRAEYERELERSVAERTRELQEKQVELERAQAMSHIGSWKMEYPGERITGSAEAFRIYGQDPSLGPMEAGVMAVVHPLDRDRVGQAWSAMRAGEPLDLEFRIVVAGEERVVHSLARAVLGERGDVLAVEGTTQDITARKRAEMELRRYAQIVETSGDLLAFVTPDLRYQVANPAYAALFDSTPEGLRDRAVREVFGEEMYELVGAYLEWALGGRDQHFLSERVFPDGRHHVLDVEYRPFRSEREVRGVVVSIRDISQRVMAERALRESERKLRAMLDTPFLFIGLLDTRGHILLVNTTALAAVQLREQDVIGQPFWEAAWLRHDPMARQQMREAVERGALGEPSHFETTYQPAVGAPRLVEFTLQPVRDEAGAVVWLVPQAVDITERKEKDALLLRDREQQAALRGLLEIILKGGSMEETLDRCLGILLEVSWLSLLPKGGIFLLDEDGKNLRLKVSRNLAPEILEQCDRVPLGHCHCGRAAATREMQFADCVDDRHDISYPGMADHGHYALPLLVGGKPRGVLVLYLPGGFRRDPVKEEFIFTVTDILSSFLQRKLAEQELERYQQNLEERVAARTAELEIVEERTRLILQSSADGLFGLDGEGRFIFANPASCAMLGFGVEEMIGHPAHALIHHSHADGSPYPAEQCPMHRALDENRLVRVEDEVFWRGDGRILRVEYAATPIRKADRVIGVVVSFRDIAERRRMEEALRESEANLAHAQSIAHVGSWYLDITGNALTWSEETYRIHGVPPGTPPSLGLVTAHIHADDAERVLAAWEQALRGRHYDIEYRIVVDGRVKWVREQAEIRFDPQERPLSGVGAVQDISELKEAELATRRALAEARQLARVKSEFLANMSHEIRTPLNAVLGLAQVGLRDSVKRKSHETFGRILDSGQLLLGIINDILDFSKIEADRMVMEEEPFSPAEVIDRAVSMIAARVYAKNLEFRLEESVDLPLSSVGDALRLSQVLVNLLSNAVKFTERGHVAFQVRVENGQLLFRVEDSGIGMSPEQISRLFTPFEQADGSTTRRYGGTGLGLAISKRLVDMMGGELGVASEPGRGSAFTLRIPLVAATARPPAPAARRVALVGFPPAEHEALARDLGAWGVSIDAEAERADLILCDAEVTKGGCASTEMVLKRGKRVAMVLTPGMEEQPWSCSEQAATLERPVRARHVLAILESPAPAAGRQQGGVKRLAGISVLAAEDNEINRLVLAEMLREEGALLICLENGREAVDQLARAGPGAYDIVLTDIQMPVMDGYETTQGVHELAPTLPVIGITAHAMAEEKARCHAAGMVEHLAKPIDLEELVAAILRHVRQRPRLPAPAAGAAVSAPARPEPVPEPVPGAVDAIIDWARLEARFQGKREFVDKLIKTAVDNQAGSPAKLRMAAAGRDYKTLAFTAHSLKGTGGILMADELHALAARAETSAREEGADALELAEQLAQAVERLLAILARRGDGPG